MAKRHRPKPDLEQIEAEGIAAAFGEPEKPDKSENPSDDASEEN